MARGAVDQGRSRPSPNTAQECEFDDELRAILCEAYFGRADEALLARMRLQALMSDRSGPSGLRERQQPGLTPGAWLGS